MERVHPFWSEEQQQAYTEAALAVCAKGEEEQITDREMFSLLGPIGKNYARQLPCALDEIPMSTFIDSLVREDVIVPDQSTYGYALGKMGNILVIRFLEEWAGTGLA